MSHGGYQNKIGSVDRRNFEGRTRACNWNPTVLVLTTKYGHIIDLKAQWDMESTLRTHIL